MHGRKKAGLKCLGPVPCRYMDLESFTQEAFAHQAVVFVAMHGGFGNNGFLQAYLQENKVPFTGPRWDAVSVATNKVRHTLGNSHTEGAV